LRVNFSYTQGYFGKKEFAVRNNKNTLVITYI
jgi:hypothetical protein